MLNPLRERLAADWGKSRSVAVLIDAEAIEQSIRKRGAIGIDVARLRQLLGGTWHAGLYATQGSVEARFQRKLAAAGFDLAAGSCAHLQFDVEAVHAAAEADEIALAIAERSIGLISKIRAFGCSVRLLGFADEMPAALRQHADGFLGLDGALRLQAADG